MESSTSDAFSSESESEKPKRDEPRKKKIRFSAAQISRLQSMYDSGTRGTGEKDLPVIKKVAKEAGLQIPQVKVCSTE